MQTNIVNTKYEYSLATRMAAEVLGAGGILAYPTETVYGLGADFSTEAAIKKIYNLKNRIEKNPLSLNLYTADQVTDYCEEVPDEFFKLFENFLPGPLTVVLKKKKNVPDFITAGMDTVALRFPDNEIFREILAIYQIPVAGTSANISGKNSAVEIESIVSEFAGKINMIINDGTSRIGRESTIIGLEGGKVRMIRQGVIPIEDINNALGGK